MRVLQSLGGVFVGLLLSGASASAVSIDWVSVGDLGNAAASSGYGAVDHGYRISNSEVTNAQYAEFLNAVGASDPNALWVGFMGPSIQRSGIAGSYSYAAVAGQEDLPVTYVSYYDALRFANWLHNGQPTGAQGASTTEDGAYTFTGPSSVGARNVGATIFLTSEDEWIKAGFYDAAMSTYTTRPFADSLNTVTCEAPPGGTTHSANCGNILGGPIDVASYLTSPSHYGTFDQHGNVAEWNESSDVGATQRPIRGGNYFTASFVLPTNRTLVSAEAERRNIGFRVAMVPEPGTGLLLLSGLIGFSAHRRVRCRRSA